MFEHWRKFPAVLPEYRYESPQQLLDTLESRVLAPIKHWEEATDKAAVKERQMREEIEAQRAEIAKLNRQLAKVHLVGGRWTASPRLPGLKSPDLNLRARESEHAGGIWVCRSFTHVGGHHFSLSVCCRASDATETVRQCDLVNGVGPSPFASDHSIRAASGRAILSGSFRQWQRHRSVLIQAQRVGDAFCPGRPPFLAPFNVVMQGDGRPDVFLSDVQMQFVDTAGIRSGTLRLGRPELATRFGSTTFAAFGTRTFPFSFPFGCGGFLPTGHVDGGCARRRFARA